MKIRLKTLFILPFLLMALPVWAQLENYHLIEDKSTYKYEPVQLDKRPHLINSYHLKYSQDDYSEEISRVNLFFSPKDYTTQMGMRMACTPYEASFEVLFMEPKKNLMEDGELPNALKMYEEKGFIYNDEVEVEVTVGDESESLDLELGGHNRYISPAFKTNVKKTKDNMGMTIHFIFVSKGAPSFSVRETNDESEEFFELLNHAVKTGQDMVFEMEADNDYERKMVWQTQRMLDFVPEEVIEFCITKRQLR